MLQLMPIEIPVFDPIVIPEMPPEMEMPEMPALITAYATVIQDFIDDRIKDFDSYYAPLKVVRAELALSRKGIFRKYDRARRELLQKEGKKNVIAMPGYLMRELNELLVEEKREITEAQLKLVQDRALGNLENIGWMVKAGLESAALRNQVKGTVSELNLEILNDAMKAGLAVTLQQVERANSLIKLTGLLIEQETVQQRVADLATIKLIAEQQIEKVNLDIMLYEIEAQGIMAELDVLAAKLVAAENEVLVLNAEIARSMAEWQVSLAQEALAAMKIITAQWERQKSDARMSAALLESQKVDVRIDKVEAESDKVDAMAAVDRANLALDIAEKNLELIREEMEVARKKAEAALTEIRADVLASEVGNIMTRTGNIYAYIMQRQQHTATAISEIEALSAKGSENVDKQVGYTQDETNAIISNVNSSIAGMGAVSSASSANVSAEIREMNIESVMASRNIDQQITGIETVTEATHSQTATTIGNITAESLAAKLVLDSRTEAIGLESAATSANVAMTIAGNQQLVSLQKQAADIQVAAMVASATASHAAQWAEANSKYITGQTSILDKKDAVTEDLETKYEEWSEKMLEMRTNKVDAITNAAKNAADAHLTSKHIYRNG